MLRRRANHPHRDGDEYGEHEKSYLIDEEASHGLGNGSQHSGRPGAAALKGKTSGSFRCTRPILAVIALFLLNELYALTSPKLHRGVCLGFRATTERSIYSMRDPSRDVGCSVKVTEIPRSTGPS